MTTKVYVQLLDGTTAWVTVNARQLDLNLYEILADQEFTDYIDPNYLHEFYPGDVVELATHRFLDGSVGQVASRLVTAGKWPDRKLNEFKFRATLGQLDIHPDTLAEYKHEIEYITTDHRLGQFYYPKIIETIETLQNLFGD